MEQMLNGTSAVAIALCYWGYLCVAGRFCRRYLFISDKEERWFVFFSFAVWLLLNFAGSHFFIPYLILMFFYRLSFVGFVFLFFSGGYGKKILTAFLLMTTMTLVRTFGESFFCVLALLFARAAGTACPEWVSGLSAGIGLGAAVWAVCVLSKRRMSVLEYGVGRDCAALALPLLLAVVILDMAGQGAAKGILLRSGGDLGVYYDQLFSHLGFCVAALLSMSAAGAYVYGIDRIFLEQRKISQYRLQIAVYQMLEEQYDCSERMRHDMKNHVIAMAGLAQNKEWEKLENYLRHMEGGCLESGADVTGNRAVDALLHQKRRQAQQGGICWECDVQIPKPCGIDEFDLCVLFGNILDNALEACERMLRGETDSRGGKEAHNGKEREADCGGEKGAGECGYRFLRIRAKTAKNCFFLMIENSVEAAERYEEGVSRKADSRGHGIGLLNVRDVARKYQGTFQAESKNGIFTTTVLIPLHAAAQDIKQTV